MNLPGYVPIQIYSKPSKEKLFEIHYRDNLMYYRRELGTSMRKRRKIIFQYALREKKVKWWGKKKKGQNVEKWAGILRIMLKNNFKYNVEILRIKSWPFRTVNSTFTKCLRQMNWWNYTSKSDLVTKKFFFFAQRCSVVISIRNLKRMCRKQFLFRRKAT